MASDSEDQEADYDEFQDACEEQSEPPSDVTLKQSLQDAQLAIDYFFNNQFDEAISLTKPWVNVSMYHSIGDSVFAFLEAILTYDHALVLRAIEKLKKSMALCNRFRKKNTIGESIGKMVKKSNYDQYTEIEAHAELCYAECLLLRAMLTFMEDETLSSFIKAGLKIRSCYNSYKECQLILDQRDWSSDTTKSDFEGGVRMGIGAFNLMISLLPSRIIKLLEFIGFSGNKELGLTDLDKGYRTEGLRKILCIMTLLGYNLVVVNVLSHLEGDLKICDEILADLLKKHPNGVWFLFFRGRLDFMKGEFDSSIQWYNKSVQSQDKWPQFHHICYWELVWLHCIKLEWKPALNFASELLAHSRWSRTIYSYQKAVIMYMMKNNLNQEDVTTIDTLFKDLPKYKQRIAGKSFPMEKFVIKKSERYFNQNKFLVLPVIELMYIWNIFKIFKKNYSCVESIFKLIERTERDFKNHGKSTKFDADNRALLLLLKGACLHQMGVPLQALECLEEVIAMQRDIQEDHYLVPYAIVELALIEWEQDNFQKAILALEDVKKNYTGYSLESRLHFRIHTALTDFKSKINTSTCVTKM